MKKLLFLFAVLLCFPALSGCGDEEKVILITVASPLPSCTPIENDCFYGNDQTGVLWRVFLKDTSDITEGATYSVTVSSYEALVYPLGYPSGWTPKYEGYATAVETVTPSVFSYSKGDTAALTVLSDQNLKERYDSWRLNFPSEYSTDETRISELIDLLDRQTWLPIYQASLSMDASLDLSRTLISEVENSAPCSEGDTVEITYIFDLDSGKVIMAYKNYNTDTWDRWCTLSESDLEKVIEVYYYYMTVHIE